MTPQDRKTQAIELRAAGQTYQQIAESTGYSVDWCKRNLKDVEKNGQEKQAIRDAIKLAQSSTGITVAQIKYLVRSVYPFQDTKEHREMEDKAIKRFKSAIKRADNALIRPYWMQPENARLSLNLIMASTDAVMVSLNSAADHVRKTLDLDMTYDISVRHAIIKLLYGSGLVPEGIENHCDRLNDLVLTLEARNSPCQSEAGRTNVHPINTYTEKCAPKYPDPQKCISVELHQTEYVDIDMINALIEDAYEAD